MQIVKRGEVNRYAFDRRDVPVLRVKPDETFQVETEDANTGLIELDGDKPLMQDFHTFTAPRMRADPPLINPVVGPIWIEGCEAGDVLAVHIDWIDPWRYGYTAILPEAGPLQDSKKWKDCSELHIQVIEHLPGPSGHTRDGKARYSDRMTWDLDPFLGTLAVAPEREVFTSFLGQGAFGGNIDCRDIQAGNTVYINSYNEGGLLYVGDAHGSQGDTEFTALADETRATVQLRCSVIKDRRLPGVRIEKPESIVTVGIDMPMDQAVYDACFHLMEWVRDDYGIEPKDMYMRMSADPDFRVRVYQMLRAPGLKQVVGAEYPRQRLFRAF